MIFEEVKKREMTYDAKNKLLIGSYSHFNQTKDKKSQKLTFGFIFMLNRGLIRLCSKK